MKILHQERFITILYDQENHWIVAEWKGYQKVDFIKFGFEKIYEFLNEYQVKKVLNNNLLLTGIWSGAAAWVGNEWYPKITSAGLSHCAWIYSQSMLSRLSTDEMMNYISGKNIIRTFSEKDMAVAWLKSVH